MKHAVRRFICALGLCLGLTATANVTILYWTGALPTGWRGGVTPVGDGSEMVFFGPAFNTNVTLLGSGSFSTVLLGGGDQYTVDAAAPVTLTITSLAQADGLGTRLYVQPNVTLNVAGAGSFDVGSGSVVLRSNLTGTGPIVLL